MDNKTRYANYVPVAAIVAGFVLIALAWNGSAGVDYPQGQIPYMISGGLSGIGLVFFGAASMLMRAIKDANARQLEQLESLAEATHRLAALVGMTTNGSQASTQDLVVIGKASFHLTTCRLVEKRDTSTQVPREEAERKGLEPCRVCNP